MREIHLSAEHLAKFQASYSKSGSCWTWNKPLDRKGYGYIYVAGRNLAAHRVALVVATGDQLGEKLVDHICRNRACVNPGHLRLVDHKQNGENRAGLQRNNSSGVQGVYWDKQTSQWRGRVYHHGRHIGVGYFQSLAEAEAAVTAARKELFTHNELDRAA